VLLRRRRDVLVDVGGERASGVAEPLAHHLDRDAGVTDLADAIKRPNVSAGEFLTVDIDQVGSATPRSDLSVTVPYTVD